MFNNKGPAPIFATPTFYSMAGTRLQLAPISVPATSYLDVDISQLLVGADEEFREGSLKISYQGGDYQLGAQIKLTDLQHNLIWAEQLVYTSKFTSSRLENVWWLPDEDSKTRLVVSNTSAATITATISVDGTTPSQTLPYQVVLVPWETRVLDIMRDIVGYENGDLHTKGGISITHSGSPGAVLARMFVAKPSKGYSATAAFIDPESTASQKWHGNGLRLRNLNGWQVRPVLVARNTGDQVSRIQGKIPYTDTNGVMNAVDIPSTPIAPHSTKKINLHNLIEDANVPNSVTYAGIELSYDTPNGTVITSVQSVSKDGDHVFQVPMFDPDKTPASAGGYPWKADGDYRTILYIKNETDQPQKYIAYLIYETGRYVPEEREIKAHQTVAIDFRKLRDEQIADSFGNVIPLGVAKGQIAWSVIGREGKSLSGRSEQISVANGVSSTYDCRNCCPSSRIIDTISPGFADTAVGGSVHYFMIGVITDCNGVQTATQTSGGDWFSSNVSIASINGGGIAEGMTPGEATITASWMNFSWFQVNPNNCWLDEYPGLDSAPISVAPIVTITKADGTALPNPFRIGINGGGNNRKQSLKATVVPANQASSVTIEVNSKITLSNVQQAGGGVITFDVVGNSASSSSGDSYVRAKRSSTILVTKPFSVVVPSKVATPHDTPGTYLAENRVLHAGTSPAFQGLAPGRVALTTIYCRILTITVKDQFDALTGDVYLNAAITETLGSPPVTYSINQSLTSGSTYSDPVCQIRFVNDVLAGSPAAASWTSEPLVPMVNESGSQNIPVQVDGFALSPAIVNRGWTATPPNTFTISWPN